MKSVAHTSVLRRLIVVGLFFALIWLVAPDITHAGGFGERLSNGSFEEGFADNGVALGWTAFNNGGAADYIYRDDTGARFLADGKHSQFLRLSTMNYFVTDPNRYSGIYQTVAVTAGTAYTLTLNGMMRVLPNDLDKNNWSYIVQWGIDPNGGTDWGKVLWNDLPWNTTYNEDDQGTLSRYTTTLVAPSNKLTLFIRALKKFPTNYRTLFVNFDGISLTGQMPTTGVGDTTPAFNITLPPYVYTTKPFTVRVTATDAIGVAEIKLTDDGNVVGTSTNAVGMLAKTVDFVWTPMTAGTHLIQVDVRNETGKTTGILQAVQVKAIAEFLQNRDFEDGFAPEGVALKWGAFNNGGRNVIEQLYDDTWKPVVASGKHSQLIEISTLGHGEFDPYAESDRYAGICQVVTGLTRDATYYLNANGALRITEGDQHTTDWSWAAQWGYLPSADPSCGAWNSVNNWQVFPWQNVGYRETPPQINATTYTFTAPSDTITIYFAAWKKWAIGAREFLVNFDNLSLAGYSAR